MAGATYIEVKAMHNKKSNTMKKKDDKDNSITAHETGASGGW